MHQQACLHALHAHKLPERGGRSPCLSATMRRRASRARRRPPAPREQPGGSGQILLQAAGTANCSPTRPPARLPAPHPLNASSPPCLPRPRFNLKTRLFGFEFRPILASTTNSNAHASSRHGRSCGLLRRPNLGLRSFSSCEARSNHTVLRVLAVLRSSASHSPLNSLTSTLVTQTQNAGEWLRPRQGPSTWHGPCGGFQRDSGCRPWWRPRSRDSSWTER